jgi:hypothetical protein
MKCVLQRMLLLIKLTFIVMGNWQTQWNMFDVYKWLINVCKMFDLNKILMCCLR